MEEGREGCGAREEVVEEGGDEVGDGLVVELELAGARLGGELGPGLAVVGVDEVGVRGVDGGCVAGHVDLEVDLDAAVGAEVLHVVEVGDGPDLVLVVGAFGGEVGEGGDL